MVFSIFDFQLGLRFNRRWHILTTPNTTKLFLYTVQTNKAVYYGHPQLPRKEKSKFELEEEKVQFITENGDLWLEN